MPIADFATALAWAARRTEAKAPTPAPATPQGATNAEAKAPAPAAERQAVRLVDLAVQAKVLIVIGVFLVVLGIAVAVWWLVYRKVPAPVPTPPIIPDEIRVPAVPSL